MPVVLLVLLAFATFVRFVLPALRCRRMMALLRGDWWSRFEHEFRSYASTGTRVARERERRT